MKKKITPKIIVNDILLKDTKQILKNRLSLDLYFSYKSNDLIFWLYRKAEKKIKVLILSI